MRIAMASDHAGYDLKSIIADILKDLGHEVHDLGADSASVSVDYPDFAALLCREIIEGRSSRGILICGTGIGISIAANRNREIRAALCHSEEMAALSREHNDANVLCLGGRIISQEEAIKCVKAFLDTKFAGGRHQTRVEKL